MRSSASDCRDTVSRRAFAGRLEAVSWAWPRTSSVSRSGFAHPTMAPFASTSTRPLDTKRFTPRETVLAPEGTKRRKSICETEPLHRSGISCAPTEPGALPQHPSRSTGESTLACLVLYRSACRICTYTPLPIESDDGAYPLPLVANMSAPSPTLKSNRFARPCSTGIVRPSKDTDCSSFVPRATCNASMVGQACCGSAAIKSVTSPTSSFGPTLHSWLAQRATAS